MVLLIIKLQEQIICCYRIQFFFYQKSIRSIVLYKMTASQSKLMLQLSKQQKLIHKNFFNEEALEEIYSIICKLEPKNLILIEFLILVIEKEFIKNSFKLIQLVELFEEIKGKNLDQDYNYNKNNVEIEEQKFSKKKFIKLLKEMSKKIFPGYPNAYETIIFDRITKNDNEDHKIKIDDSIKKMLSKETISTIHEFDHQFQIIFQLYMPQNYNLNLNFSWNQIKILEKKLPITCFFRFLFEAEVVPCYVTPIQFLQIISKIKPPSLPNSNNSKEAMFYTSQTFAVYMRDCVYLPQIKLLEGDIGLTYLEFQIFLVKIATEFCKDVKNEYSSNIRKMASYMNLKEAFDDSLPSKKNKFIEIMKNYIKHQHNKSDKIMVKKRQSRKKIEDLYDAKDIEIKQQSTKNVFKNMTISSKEIESIKRQLDSELPQMFTKKKVEKENEGYYDVEKKHIVIGEQLPKIPQKNKQNAPKDGKKKNEDVLLGYKAQIPKTPEESDIRKIVRRPKKLRANNQFPIILNEVFYPSDLKPHLFISSSAELYLETSYIHLGEKLYEQAYQNFLKAKQVTESKSTITEFYYNIHAAQIFQTAGKDQIALCFYHKAKQLVGILTSIDNSVRSFPYIGLGCVLYHMEEYQYAFRCYEKARIINGIHLQMPSLENAILQNNIACCLMMLNRNQQAIKHFTISHNLLDLKVGCFDERTLVVQQNFNKNKKAYLQMLPEFKTMWKTYVEKGNNKLPAVRAGVKQKK